MRLKPEGDFSVRREYGRIFVDCNSDYDYDRVMEKLTKIFGITGVCPVVVTDVFQFDAIAELLTEYVREVYEDDMNFTFKMKARRNNKSFPIHTMEMDARLGEVLLNNFEKDGLRVDVHKPDVIINVEIREIAVPFVPTGRPPGPGIT